MYGKQEPSLLCLYQHICEFWSQKLWRHWACLKKHERTPSHGDGVVWNCYKAKLFQGSVSQLPQIGTASSAKTDERSTCSMLRQWPACKQTVPFLVHEELSESHNKSCLHNFVGAVWSCLRRVYTSIKQRIAPSQRHDRVLSIRREMRAPLWLMRPPPGEAEKVVLML